ncbi:MAG TPA: four-carbon acid sugar kinase family protein [Candidatus Binatia bacterium]|nr:four-carbon acid sugar kinase family protein [Candidatus Binatia bacterium]
MHLTIVADDLTGACDTGALFAGGARVAVFVAPDTPGPEWHTAAVDTATRALDAPGAQARVREVADRLSARIGAGRLFKKIDSTMRGHVGAEIDALMDAGPVESAVICPAFPEQGRRVVDGLVTVNGRPVHETAIGQDPTYPGHTSRVVELLAAGTARPMVHLPLATVRGAGPDLVRVLKRAPGGLIVPDAETPGDLDTLARAALHHRRVLLAGSAGLARAMAALLGAPSRPGELPTGRAWLIVVGSPQPASQVQVEALGSAGAASIARLENGEAAAVAEAARALEAGRPAVMTDPAARPSPAPRQADVAGALARATAAVLAIRRPDLLAVVGGETLHSVFRVLGAGRLELTGAPAAGLALGTLVAGGGRLPILTKAGGFGDRDLWLGLLRSRPQPLRA